MNNSPRHSAIRDHAKALMWVGKFITIHTRNRPIDMHPGINGLGFPGMKVPRIEIYYPLRHGDMRDDVIAHECAHFYYADMRSDKSELEMEAIKIIEPVEPSIFDFYWGRPDLGEECVVRLADFRRQGRRLPRMSPRLSAVTRTLAAPKPFRVGMLGSGVAHGPVCYRPAPVRGAVMIFRFFPRMRLTSPGIVTRTRIVRKAGGQAQKNPESGSKSAGEKGLRVLVVSCKRRRKVLADWLRTRRVGFGMKRKKGTGTGGAVAAGLAARVHVDVTADLTRRVYRDLKRPMASG